MTRNVHTDGVVSAAYTGRLGTDPVPALRLPENQIDPDAAYRFIHDELMLDGSSRLNLATFVTTWMDPQAEKLMAETFDKNMIDRTNTRPPPPSSSDASTWSPICSTHPVSIRTIRPRQPASRPSDPVRP